VKYWSLAKKKFHTRIRGRTLRKMLHQASLPEERVSKSEDECKLLCMEAKDAFERFKPTATKLAEEMRRALGKRIAKKTGTDPEDEFKKLSRHVQQKELRLKIRRVDKKLKKGLSTSLSWPTPPLELSPQWKTSEHGGHE
jgi:tRNA U54 and U55 pseudouridine synthase Pus10